MTVVADRPARAGTAAQDAGRSVRVWRSMLELHAALIGELAEAFRDCHDLSVSEFDVLVNLDVRQPIRHGELSARVILSRTALTRLVDRLVVRGLVCRVADPADQRAVRVGLTPAGRRLRAASARTNRCVVEDFFAGVDPGSLAAVQAVTTTLLARHEAARHTSKGPRP